MKPEVLPMTIEGKAWPNEFPHAGYRGIGCDTCATDFARSDSNIFICTECVARLLIHVFHGTNPRDLQRSTDLCLPASMCEIKKAGGKDCSKDASFRISFTMFHVGPQSPI